MSKFNKIVLEKDERPNILFIMTDQWRADCFGFEGHPTVKTPHLDNLVNKGISCNHAYSATPTCVPARAGLLTGLSQKNHGFVGYNAKQEWDFDCTLPKVLSDHGYHTQCIGKTHIAPARKLLGFHNIILHDGYGHRNDFHKNDDYMRWLKTKRNFLDADYLDTGLSSVGYAVQEWPYEEMEHPSAWVSTESINFLDRRDPTMPFFLMSSYHRPHPPLDPPQSAWNRYKDKQVPDSIVGDWVSQDVPFATRGLTAPVPADPEEIADAKRAYYAQINFIDAQINRILLDLQYRKLLGNTIIIFSSDHGEMLYDHNCIAKQVPFEASARVPLFFFIPPQIRERLGIQGNGSIEEVVELRDIFPTVCDMLNIDIPNIVDGKSLVPLMKKEYTEWRPYLHGEHSKHSIFGSNQWLNDGREKYIWFPDTGQELLFNLDDDPNELHDLSSSLPDRLVFWRSLLIDELKDREEGFVKDGALQVGVKTYSVLKKSYNKAKYFSSEGTQ